MLIVQHRVNSSAALAATPKEFGVELDIRSDVSGLYLAHDPFVSGERFEAFLDDYTHQLLVLNVKEEGLEDRVEELLGQRGISSYFFLDQSLPFLIKRGLKGHLRQAARMSEYESIDSVRRISKFCDWAWVDFFYEPSFDRDAIEQVQSLGLKICLVSPELHGAHREHEAAVLAQQVKNCGLKIEAVCTKFPGVWSEL
jgi:hypothetical protein